MARTFQVTTGREKRGRSHGLQLLRGEQIYRDFIQFTPPGTDLIYLGFFRLLGPKIVVTNLVVLMVGVILSWVCFRLCRQFLGTRSAALASLLFVVLIYGRLINATHHWFSLTLILLAVTVLMVRRTINRVFFAGLLVGLAAFFTQSHAQAAALAIALFLTWERHVIGGSWRRLAAKIALLSLGIFAMMLVIYSPYLVQNGLHQLWDAQVTYVRTYLLFRVSPNFGLPDVPRWTNLLTVGPSIVVYGVVFTVYPLVLRRCWLRRESEESLRVALLTLIGLALLLEVLVSLNWLRLYAVSMPAVILAVWAAGHAGRFRLHALKVLTGVVVVLALGQTASRQLQPMVSGQLPGGAVAANPQSYAKLRWLATHTTPGEAFFQAAWPGLYLPLGLRNPLFLDTLPTYEPTRPEYITRTIVELDQNAVRYILWQPQIGQTDATRAWQSELLTIRDYLRREYRLVYTFPDFDEVWERQRTSSQSVPSNRD
ncbi:MAG TPA: hypothetical protein VJX67_05100 [Blastocatellia bacterium]|nr:hypothetical protein [Blastocatellia bacterium]